MFCIINFTQSKAFIFGKTFPLNSDVHLGTSHGQTTKLPVDKLQLIVKLATSGQTTIFRDTVLTYKCVNNLAPDYL